MSRISSGIVSVERRSVCLQYAMYREGGRIKDNEQAAARRLRAQGYSLHAIAEQLHVAKSSVSLWVRNIRLDSAQIKLLAGKPFTSDAIELRRAARLANEASKRGAIQAAATAEVPRFTNQELWFMGVMLYWAEGGKTQRMVRFSNGDPQMIRIMMQFFRTICNVPESKFRGYIHIHPDLGHQEAERYWSAVAGIPIEQFFKTYRKPNKSSQNKKHSLPYGVLDIYVLDTALFLKISGWAQGVFSQVS